MIFLSTRELHGGDVAVITGRFFTLIPITVSASLICVLIAKNLSSYK